MKIKRVLIENFRSIRFLEFYPADICVLVGENNAGKTNILAAINFLLGETWPSRKGLEKTDYYNQDISQAIHIEVEFEDNPQRIKRIWCTIPWEGRAETKAELYDGGVSYLTNEVREHCALVYLDANRNLEYHLGYSRWALFGRIIRQLDSYFRENASDAQKQALEDCFTEVLGILRSDLYNRFEAGFKEAFHEQIKQTTHAIEVEFHTFDPLNYYRSLYLRLVENNTPKNPSEAGQGMRNLVLLALFRTYAKIFRGDAIIAIEEPEIYLHPHTQRSLATLFDELAKQGNQIFYSTHSGNFINIEYFDRICLVEKREDSQGNMSTQVRQVPLGDLLNRRRSLHPGISVTERSLRERYRNICRLEHNEAFFARKIVLVEGETEEYALPIYARALGYDFDSNNVSVVNAHGKDNLDQLYQMYQAFGIPIYLIFDNDRGGEEGKLRANETLLRLLDQPVCREPDGVIADVFAILEGDFEKEMMRYLGDGKYNGLKNAAAQELGAKAGKGLVARFMAQQLISEGTIPEFIKEILCKVKSLGRLSEKDGELQDQRDIKAEFPF